MTYKELYESAIDRLEKSKITLGEFEEMIEPLNAEIATADPDTISRQAAIDALDEQIEQCDKALSSFDISIKDGFAVKVERASLVAFRETLEYLPPAQPEQLEQCPIYGGMRAYPSDQCYDCPRHAGAKMEVTT